MVAIDTQRSFAIPRITVDANSFDARPDVRQVGNLTHSTSASSIRPLTVVERQREIRNTLMETRSYRSTESTSSPFEYTMSDSRSREQAVTQQQEGAGYQHGARRQAQNDMESQYEAWYRQMEHRNRTAQQANRSPPTEVRTMTTPQHRVYLINCRGCGAFLTDRGMKAVLLLRPHITLFSTDAMPHCGPLHAPSRLCEPSLPSEPAVERTCDCLTQTLGCYGCGTAVGYHIVSPCLRCTSSVSKHQRSSNGHRTVLHCAEITVRERRYVPGEPGVRVAPYKSRAIVRGSQHASNRSVNVTRFNIADERNYQAESDDEYDEDDYLEDDEASEMYDKGLREGLLRDQGDLDTPRSIKRGEVVYWSDLVSGGERSAPLDSDELLSMPVAGR